MVRRPRQAPTPPVKERPKLKITDAHLAYLGGRKAPFVQPFSIAQHPPGVAPSGMAMDDMSFGATSWAAQAAIQGAFAEGQAFLGYPLLTELAQRPEFRRISEVIATEMTRKWVKIKSTGDQDKQDKIDKIEDEMKRLGVQDAFKKCAEHDGFFGRSHLYIDTGDSDNPDELKIPIGENKIKRDSLIAIKPIEAYWCYPTGYNSSDPLSPDWYKPQQWFVLGKQMHASRLLTFVGREVPDMLKPAYSFGGLSLTQMARPYVDNWLRTRQSVSDIVKSFSIFVLNTNLLETLAMGSDEIFKRLRMFALNRDNAGVMAIDKEMEAFQNVSAPLGTLDKLQAQSLEQICSVTGIPLVKYTGISPSGLNASSEEEMDCFNTAINAAQESLFTPNLTKLLGYIQLSKFGSIDPDITFEYEPLHPLDEMELATVRKLEAETGAALIAAGAITPAEERERIQDDPQSAYASLDKKLVSRLDNEMAEVGAKVITSLMQVAEGGKISDAMLLTELRKLSKSTGLFTTITDADIADAEQEAPDPVDVMRDMEGAKNEAQMDGPAGLMQEKPNDKQ